MGDPRLTQEATDSADTSAARLHLIVVGDAVAEAHPLPASGEVIIGRSPECAVQIDHPEISREHARLRIGDTITVEDLDSRNGIRVNGARVALGAPAELQLGQAFELGTVLCVLQARASTRKVRRLWSHAFFEGRLEEECARGARFAVARLRLLETTDPDLIRDVISGALRPADLAAAYAPGEYELLLLEANETRANEARSALEAALESRQIPARVGLACHPRDGRTPDVLLGRASTTLRGPAPEIHHRVIEDPAMRDLYRVADRIAKGTISVLLLGETGAGKEVLAEDIHAASPRRDGRFTAINCAALSETLLESELFGHEKGAFTGALKTKTGLFESAQGGTVFLDEVGEMPASLQAKLLRTLERRQIIRVGGTEPIGIDVRIISATNRDLEAEVDRSAFRRDLYYRLAGVTLSIPPLRDRPGEILPLAETFAAEVARELGREVPVLSDDVRALLMSYRWPGNIRELRNVMERAVLLAPGNAIETTHVPHEKMTADWSSPSVAVRASTAALPAPEEAERRRILDALARTHGNQTRAAQVLGIGRRTLTAKLTKYQLPRPRKT
ncbi:MAG: sigma 54-interacting transcriptional regulator [Deltaproteobacteria bacterium]|nr:sigma 54-interacting transcriptional regulator [Deltaproteobacteria bacterium]